MDSKLIEQLLAAKGLKSSASIVRFARQCYVTNNCTCSYWSLFYVLDKSIHSLTSMNSSDCDGDDVVETRRLLGTLMSALEKEKTMHRGDPLYEREEVARQHIERYANQLLVRAENETQLDVAVKLFIAAANASQVLTFFGENSEQNMKRIKYCKWKAVKVNDAKKVKTIEKCNKNECEKRNPNPSLRLQENAFSEVEKNEPETLNLSLGKKNSVAKSENLPTQIDFDLKKAELFCKSALYAIRGKDLLGAVTNLKQTLQELQKKLKTPYKNKITHND